MSILNVNQLQPVGGGNTITVGSSNIDYSGSITGNISVDGNLTVTGVVSNEDVTNIDSVGIVTAQSGIHVTGGSVGIGTDNPTNAYGIDKSLHVHSSLSSGTRGSGVHLTTNASGNTANDGVSMRLVDTDLSIDNRESGLINFLTAGTERLRITSAGTVKIGSNTLITPSTDADNFVIDTGDIDSGLSILSATTGRIYFGDAASTDQGSIRYVHTDDSMRFETNSSEKLRITSSGQVIVNGTENLAHPNMDDIVVGDASGNRGITVASGDSGFGTLAFGDSTDGSGNDRYQGFVEYYHSENSLRLGTVAQERFRISNIGHVITKGNNQGNPVGIEIRNNNTNAYSHAELSLTSQNATTSKIWCDVPNSGMRLNYNGGTSVKIDQSGNLVMGNGSGIDFSADPDASGRESELLDDYEHGTFTPIIKVESSGTNAAIDNVSGTYVKVGKLVYVGFHCELNGLPSGRSSSAAIEFHNMPFTSLAEGSSGIEEHLGSVRCHPVDNGTSLGACSEFILRMFDNNTMGRIEARKSDGNLANASLYMRDNMQISAAITYRTAS